MSDDGGSFSHTDGTVRVTDALGGVAGFRPGFCLTADSSDASEALHERRKKDLAMAWRKRKRKRRLAPQPQPGRINRGGAFAVPRAPDGYDNDEGNYDDDRGLSELTLDELKLRAERAREDRDERLANGWRNR